MRLTIEQIKDYGKDKEYLTNAELALIKELLEYKELEIRLGIDLITLVKALKNGIYVKTKGSTKIEYHYLLHLIPDDDLDSENLWDYMFEFTKRGFVYLKDYGKTWALTKEELE